VWAVASFALAICGVLLPETGPGRRTGVC
jgi:hypothetical protein